MIFLNGDLDKPALFCMWSKRLANVRSIREKSLFSIKNSQAYSGLAANANLFIIKSNNGFNRIVFIVSVIILNNSLSECENIVRSYVLQ